MCVTGTVRRSSERMQTGRAEMKDEAAGTELKGLFSVMGKSEGGGGGEVEGMKEPWGVAGEVESLVVVSSTVTMAVATAAGGGAGGGGQCVRPKMSLEAALLEVEARFLLNLPDEELSSVDRLFFQMEQAHWYYEDFLADHHDGLPHFHLEGFTLALFKHSQLLQHLTERHADMVRDFYSYKYAVPVYGCILLNPAMDKLVLVCNWEGTAWGLPRGKVNEGEHPMDCAVRETLEECGFDASGRVNEEDSFTIVQNSKRITLYVVQDVSEDTVFCPQVRKEVSEVRFFSLDALPRTSYNVQPCLAHIRRWMAKRYGGEDGNHSSKQRRGPEWSSPIGGRIPSSSPIKKGGKGRGPSPSQKGGGGGVSQTPGPRQGSKGGRTGSAGRSRSAPVHHDVNDANNLSTFGVESITWDVDSMFKANEQLTGRQFTYDGNPQRFGEYDRHGAAIAASPPLVATGTKTTSGAATNKTRGARGKKRAGVAQGSAGEKAAGGAGASGMPQQQQEDDGTANTVEGLDLLDKGFQFDTQDILSALLF